MNEEFDWKKVVSGLASAVPYALLAYQQNRRQNQSVGTTTVTEQVEQAREYLQKAKKWIDPFRLGGIYLMGDGIISILTRLKEKPKHHIPRVIRAGIGFWLFKIAK